MTWTYTIEGRRDLEIKIKAPTPLAACRIAAEFGMAHRLMLTGPRELDRQPVYI